jgi:hypothetical protein
LGCADHDPSGAPVTSRRAIQLGLKNVEPFANGEDILRIDDLSPFVAECARNDPARLVTPKYTHIPPCVRVRVCVCGGACESFVSSRVIDRETIYEPNDPALGAILRLSSESEVLAFTPGLARRKEMWIRR